MKEKIASVAAIVSASLASICCIGPLVLVGLGLSGAGLAASLTKYRPFFLGLTAVVLGLLFYRTYRKREVTCANGSCELRSGSRLMKAALWVITAIAAGLVTFPNWSSLLLSGPAAAVSANTETIVLTVSGMTCTACTVSIEKSIKKIPGVRAASVSFDTAEAIVHVEPGKVSASALLKAVQAAGQYTAEVKKAG